MTTAPGEGLEPPIFRLTADCCTNSAIPEYWCPCGESNSGLLTENQASLATGRQGLGADGGNRTHVTRLKAELPDRWKTPACV